MCIRDRFSPERLVIQIEDNSIVHPVAQKMIYRYRKQGYSIASAGFEFSPRYFGIMDALDYIKVNFGEIDEMHPTNSSLVNIVNIAHSFQKKVIAFKVNTPEAVSYTHLDVYKRQQHRWSINRRRPTHRRRWKLHSRLTCTISRA